MESEQSYEAQERYKIEGAATPAHEQATIDMEDRSFRENVAVLYDPSNWIVQYLKPSGRKLNGSFRAMKTKSLLRLFHCNQERRLARMVRLLQSIRNALKQLDVAIKLPGDGVEQSELAQAILSKVPAKEIAHQANQLFF